jgi:L-ornithine Nalpha-acyltransferase
MTVTMTIPVPLTTDTTPALQKGRYLARLAQTPADVAAAQTLRHLCFVEGAGLPARPGGLDRDGFDEVCAHLMIEDAVTGTLAGCCRLMTLPDGTGIGASYSAQSYDLSRLGAFAGPMLELGRFCVHPAASNGDVLRVAWGALTRLVDAKGVQMLFGCSSFAGTDPAAHAGAFGLLARRHIGPARWLPGVKARQTVPLAGQPGGEGAAGLPPLLRSYLAMGGWVSDHAVVDPEMNTLHVFTALEPALVPPGRVRALRAVAG